MPYVQGMLQAHWADIQTGAQNNLPVNSALILTAKIDSNKVCGAFPAASNSCLTASTVEGLTLSFHKTTTFVICVVLLVAVIILFSIICPRATDLVRGYGFTSLAQSFHV